MSTYSTNLKIELIGTGEQAGTWGVTTDDNFSNVFEQAIVGRVTVPFSDADVTLTATNSVSSQSFRNVYLNCTGTNTASKNLIVPTINKNYVVQNNTTGGFSIVVKTSAGTGITVPNGKTCTVYADGTNVIQAFDYLPVATVGTLTITSITAGSITDSGLTSGRVTYATTGGLLTDDADLTFDGTTLTAAKGAVFATTSGAVGIGTASPASLLHLNRASGVPDIRLSVAGTLYGTAYASSSDFTINSVTSIPLILGTNNAERMRIDSTGNVGIGTSSPARRVDARTTSSDYQYRAGDSASGVLSYDFGRENTAGLFKFYGNQTGATGYIFDGVDGERMRITTTGNVGIGTSSPAHKLTVASGWLATDNTYGLLGKNSTAAYKVIAQLTSGNLYAFGEGALNIDSSGNVGIGTSSPAQKLDVAGNLVLSGQSTADQFIRVGANRTGNGYSYIDLQGDTTYSNGLRLIRVNSGANSPSNIEHRGTGGFQIITQEAAPIVLYTTATERMRIDSSGNLLVNTSTQISQGKGNIAFNGSSHQGLNLQETVNQASAGFMYFQYNTTILGTITRNAGTNAVLYNTSSDVRLKENIADAKPALKTISDIKVRQYDWIGTDYHQDYGFIAQELVEVVSDVVTKGLTEEDNWGVDYGKLTPILVKAIQEQQALIENLTTRLNALEGK